MTFSQAMRFFCAVIYIVRSSGHQVIKSSLRRAASAAE